MINPEFPYVYQGQRCKVISRAVLLEFEDGDQHFATAGEFQRAGKGITYLSPRRYDRALLRLAADITYSNTGKLVRITTANSLVIAYG